ncbi:MAG: Rieske 2Fe-2S domain-containing protein [Candidatus Kapabacteria bacterium]|nr:Rieske 2Fe-2S domain-containing protein [Candidatus Kapabacteria bacterium]
MTAPMTRNVDGVRYVRLCNVLDLPQADGKAFDIDDLHTVAVFRLPEGLFVVSNVCPHKRMSVICNGMLSGTTVQCPMHGWRFDLRSGANMAGQAPLRVYRHVQDGDWVWVEWPDDERPAWADAL